MFTGDSELLLDRTFEEVGFPVWVERVGIFPDFYVAPDFGFARISKARPDRLAVRSLVARFCRERPSSIAQGWEATLLDPGA